MQNITLHYNQTQSNTLHNVTQKNTENNSGH